METVLESPSGKGLGCPGNEPGYDSKLDAGSVSMLEA